MRDKLKIVALAFGYVLLALAFALGSRLLGVIFVLWMLGNIVESYHTYKTRTKQGAPP